ncbi:hypothetical protein PRIPAC_94838 [Pristionchus pacificus]|uniref:Uncharacterized protein n=1 Tax=Pristionchus pacificus TaxID=54126 RepID=A0A2A6B435_PRIPA|nr:hypothetical protein PRIPAC_94838 [Pristionchus pacificus]|eukprot:PDM60645.1 hypothetical protein PRIPAC_53914 [Pristionchus pacificus]
MRISLLFISMLLSIASSQSFESSFLPSHDSLIWTEWSEWSSCRCGDSHRWKMTMDQFRRRQRHCIGSTPSCGACGTEWTRCPLSASTPCSVEVSDWSSWLPTTSGDAFRFRCWSQLQPNKTVLVGLRGEGRQLFTPESPRPCTSQSNVHSTTASAIINNSTFTYLPLIISFLAGIIIGVGIIIVIEYCRDKRSERKRFDISQYSFVADRNNPLSLQSLRLSFHTINMANTAVISRILCLAFLIVIILILVLQGVLELTRQNSHQGQLAEVRNLIEQMGDEIKSEIVEELVDEIQNRQDEVNATYVSRYRVIKNEPSGTD